MRPETPILFANTKTSACAPPVRFSNFENGIVFTLPALLAEIVQIFARFGPTSVSDALEPPTKLVNLAMLPTFVALIAVRSTAIGVVQLRVAEDIGRAAAVDLARNARAVGQNEGIDARPAGKVADARERGRPHLARVVAGNVPRRGRCSVRSAWC